MKQERIFYHGSIIKGYIEAFGYVKMPSQQPNDALVETFKDRLKADHK